MNTNGDQHTTQQGPVRRSGLGRRARLWVAALALIGAGMVGGALIASATDASAHGAWRGHHYGESRGLEHHERHARHAAQWLADEVDATAEQKERIDAIAAELVARIYPLRSAHRANKQALLVELAEPTVNHDALEQLRQAELGLAESASRYVTEAVAELADVLTPEQRAALVERMAHGRH